MPYVTACLSFGHGSGPPRSRFPASRLGGGTVNPPAGRAAGTEPGEGGREAAARSPRSGGRWGRHLPAGRGRGWQRAGVGGGCPRCWACAGPPGGGAGVEGGRRRPARGPRDVGRGGKGQGAEVSVWGREARGQTVLSLVAVAFPGAAQREGTGWVKTGQKGFHFPTNSGSNPLTFSLKFLLIKGRATDQNLKQDI